MSQIFGKLAKQPSSKTTIRMEDMHRERDSSNFSFGLADEEDIEEEKQKGIEDNHNKTVFESKQPKKSNLSSSVNKLGSFTRFKPALYLNSVQQENKPVKSVVDVPPPPPLPTSPLNASGKTDFQKLLLEDQKKEFQIPCEGPAFLRSVGSLKQAPQEWTSVFLVLNKPNRSLTIYSGKDKKRIIEHIEILQEMKEQRYSEKKHAHCLELSLNGAVLLYLSFTSDEVFRKWRRDVEQAILGLEHQENSNKAHDPDHFVRVGKLNSLYAQDLINEDELNYLIERSVEGKTLGLPQRKQIAKEGALVVRNLKCEQGILDIGSVKFVNQIDFSTYEATSTFAFRCVYTFTKDEPIEWLLSKTAEEFRTFYSQLIDPAVGMLALESIDRLPTFPHFAFVNAAKYDNNKTKEAQARHLETFVIELVKFVRKIDLDDDTPPPPPPPEDEDEPPPPSPSKLVKQFILEDLFDNPIGKRLQE